MSPGGKSEMNIERSFTFAFKAPGAAGKLVLGGVFSLLFFTVFFAFVVMGYVMRVLCDALEGRDAKLPEWKDIGGLFNEGLMPMLVVLIYSFPLIVLVVIEQLVGMNLGLLVVFLSLRLALLLILSVVLPLALIRFAVKSSMRAAFDFGEILSFIRRNPGIYFTAWGLAMVVGLVSSLGLVALGIGIFFTSFVANVIAVHLYAQAYRAARPFTDDDQGELRASMAIPPPLS